MRANPERLAEFEYRLALLNIRIPFFCQMKGFQMIGNTCIVFEYKGKVAHFLKAEANVSAPSYPFPTRTVLFGLVGAILGLEKDTPQEILKTANFAISGKSETTHWHTATLRQTYPAPLPSTINKNSKGSSGAQKLPKQITQEWLIDPHYKVFTQLPSPYHNELLGRLKERRWHFSPCLGLSEMAADIKYVDSFVLEPLSKGVHSVSTVVRKSQVKLDMETLLEAGAAIKSIRMPREATPSRQFFHEDYFYEVSGGSLPVETANAFKAGEQVIQWL